MKQAEEIIQKIIYGTSPLKNTETQISIITLSLFLLSIFLLLVQRFQLL